MLEATGATPLEPPAEALTTAGNGDHDRCLQGFQAQPEPFLPQFCAPKLEADWIIDTIYHRRIYASLVSDALKHGLKPFVGQHPYRPHNDKPGAVVYNTDQFCHVLQTGDGRYHHLSADILGFR